MVKNAVIKPHLLFLCTSWAVTSRVDRASGSKSQLQIEMDKLLILEIR